VDIERHTDRLETYRSVEYGVSWLLENGGTSNDVLRPEVVVVFHLLIGQEDLQPDDATAILDAATPARLGQAKGKLTHAVRAALLLEGIDTSGASGRLSSAHTDEDLAQTLASFDRALDRLLRWEVF
jgi:hypothetical protein